MKTVIKVFSIINLVCLSIMSIIPVFWFYTIPLIIVNALTLKRVKTTMKHKAALIAFDFYFGDYLLAILLLCYKENKECPTYIEDVNDDQEIQEEPLEVKPEVVEATEIKQKKPMHVTGKLSIIFASISMGLVVLSNEPFFLSIMTLFMIAGLALGIVSVVKKSSKVGLILSIVSLVVLILYYLSLIVALFISFIPVISEIIKELVESSGGNDHIMAWIAKLLI
mgnify:FL=1